MTPPIELPHIADVRALLQRHGFTFSKKLGQNFLINPTVCPRMAQACGIGKDGGVLEIGPGIGVLTRELAKVAGRVVAIELDDRLPPVLRETLADCDNVTVVQGDAMKLDLHALLAAHFPPGMPVAVCANLPYYITSPLIMRLLESRLPLTSVTVMVQKEAAERLCAAPGTRECGAVSLAVQYYAEPQPLFAVSRGSFMPAPHVDSAVIRLAVRPQPPVTVADEKRLFAVIRAAFGQRRKTLVNAVSAAGYTSAEIRAALDDMGLSPTVRAEELTLAQFAALTDRLTAGQ